nr:class I SAM-dependent methyltransferase [Acetatifactor sp.]
IATDFSEKMLAVARRGMVPSNLTYEWADAQNLPYENESFDVVIIANALHVIPDPVRVLKEIRRVLRPDGVLIAPNFVHDNHKKVSEVFSKALSVAGVEFKAKWSKDGYLAFLEENGFHVTGARELPSTIPLTYAECTKA